MTIPLPKIPLTDGLKSIEASITYIEQQGKCSAHDVVHLKR